MDNTNDIVDDDGLITPEVKSWGVLKHRLVSLYAQMFLRAMAGKPWWNNLTYIDLFCGPGRARSNDGLIRRTPPTQILEFDGSFTKYIFNDNNPEFVEALRSRVNRDHLGKANLVQCSDHDTNAGIDQIVKQIPEKESLSFCLLDP